jgi:Tol biopolymer transport system component
MIVAVLASLVPATAGATPRAGNGDLFAYTRSGDAPSQRIQTWSRSTGQTHDIGNVPEYVPFGDSDTYTEAFLPSFSPDGAWVAYSSNAPEAGTFDLWLVRGVFAPTAPEPAS